MKVLIVDDEKNIRNSIARFLETEDIRTVTAENGLAAQRKLQEESFDLAVVDLKMPGLNGHELLKWIDSENINLPVIMISAYGEIDDAVSAMKMGARDYIVKPFDPEELTARIKKIAEEEAVKTGAQEEASGIDDGYFIGETPVIAGIKKIIAKIAASSSTVLITGESGTGKEVAARSIHNASGRAKNSFYSVNIGGIPDTLLESELFGYEKGAFTGADRQKAGLFEVADGGTLFLDEIGDMPMQLQVKILRVLQERQVRRLGSNVTVPVNVRILAATNKDLEKLIKEGRFREDLYFRLNVIKIELPPLRERMDDIPLLAGALIRKLNRAGTGSIKGLTADAIERLKKHRFPGNIRELENILERASVMAEGDMIGEHDLGLTNPEESDTPVVTKYDELEKQAIIGALQKWEGNRTKASHELGISRRTIINKINKYGLK